MTRGAKARYAGGDVKESDLIWEFFQKYSLK